MAWRRKKGKDVNTSIPLARLATPAQISSYIKKIVNSSQYDYNETESFEVTKVIMNDSQNHGAVLGTFINNPNQEILGGVVLPLMPHISHIPLIGEHVVVVEYNGQHYYTGIINRKNSPNENSIPGTVGGYIANTKYGDTFERKDIRRVHVCEGEIVYEGRYGNTIKLGCNHTDNSPNIKIRVGQQTPPENKNDVVRENIEKDGSSIYLLENGLPWYSESNLETFDITGKEDGDIIEGKKILIKSDGIFISGREDIKLRCIKNVRIDAPNFSVIEDEIKLGDTKEETLQPLVRGDDLINLLDDMITAVDNAFKAAAPTMVTGPSPGSPVAAQSVAPFSGALTTIKTTIKAKKVLSKKVKTT